MLQNISDLHMRHLAFLITLLAVVRAQAADGGSSLSEESARIISACNGEFSKPPARVPTNFTADGPLLGNGDLGVVIGGPPEKQQFWISKCDYWRARPMYPYFTPALIGCLDIRIPGVKGASYNAHQNLYTAQVSQTFAAPGATVTMRSWTPATQNALVVELSGSGKPLAVEIGLWTQQGNGATVATGQAGDALWLTRSFTGPDLDWPSEAVLAVRSSGGIRSPDLKPESKPDVRESANGKPGDSVPFNAAVQHLTLAPDNPIRIVVAVKTNHETPNFQSESLQAAGSLVDCDIELLREKHREWWRSYWAESFVEIGDPLLEKYYYGAFYIMACCSRNAAFPPALFGNWASGDLPAMGCDYHLNYNYEAPWWGCFIANHIGITDPYDTPILQYMDHGRMMARNYLGRKGVLYCVGIGPKGSCSCWEKPHNKWEDDREDKHFFGQQKSNAAFAAINMVMRWQVTRDLDYARKIYPFLREVADFWEDDLVFEDGRYVITHDAVQEGSGPDVNAIQTLGLLRTLFQTIGDISTELGVDMDRRAKWADILARLSGFSYQKAGEIKREWISPDFLKDPANLEKPVFRYSEKGTAWWPDCTLGVQQIFPAGAIGLESPPEWLEISRNTIAALGRWDDANHTMTFYPAAARVGYDPQVILAHLREQCGSPQHAFANLALEYGGGGLEACSTVTATLNEMLLQSHQGVLRLFADWPRSRDARFANLRARGAFLVAARQKGGVVQGVTILSEKGRDCTLVNPWPGKSVRMIRQDKTIETLGGQRLTFKTRAGDQNILEPVTP